MKKILLFAASLILIASCQDEALVPAITSNNPLASPIDRAVHQAFLNNQQGLNTVGISIGILKNDSLYFYGYGETKKGNGTAPNSHTFFEIGSITKTFTAITIANMLLENNHTIENNVRAYLPSELPTLQRGGIEVNFKHVLTHTSGLPYFPDNMGLSLYTGHMDKALATYDRNKLYTCLKNEPLKFTPFTSMEYSNTGFGLLGTILELNYNKNYKTIVNEKLLLPLGMSETKTDKADTDVDNWATGYNINGKQTDYWNSLNALDGAGVLKSNAYDMLKYARANIFPPTSRLGDAINLTHAVTYLPFDNRGDSKINGRLGWFQYIATELPNDSFIWHNGGTGGFNSELFIHKQKQSAVVILFNTDGNSEARENFKLEMLKLISR